MKYTLIAVLAAFAMTVSANGNLLPVSVPDNSNTASLAALGVAGLMLMRKTLGK